MQGMDKLHPIANSFAGEGFLARTIPKMGGLKVKLKDRKTRFNGSRGRCSMSHFARCNGHGQKPYSFLVPRGFCLEDGVAFRN
jgi:hypothetical protein